MDKITGIALILFGVLVIRTSRRGAAEHLARLPRFMKRWVRPWEHRYLHLLRVFSDAAFVAAGMGLMMGAETEIPIDDRACPGTPWGCAAHPGHWRAPWVEGQAHGAHQYSADMVVTRLRREWTHGGHRLHRGCDCSCVGSEINWTRPTLFCESAYHQATCTEMGKCAPAVSWRSFSCAALAHPCHFGSSTVQPCT
jgi:hypothetical protein